jgi:hypothetical protein
MFGPVRWKLACQHAFGETDFRKISKLVAAAILLLHERLDELGLNQGSFMRERLEIVEAFRQLDTLNRRYRTSSQLGEESFSSAVGSAPKELPLR